MTSSDIVIGPCERIVSKIQPTNGRLVSSVGGTNAWNWPAPVGEDLVSRVFR